MPALKVLDRLVWPLLLLGAAVFWLAALLGGFSSITADLIGRLWPTVLILIGLLLLIGRRLPIGNLIALGITIFAAGMVVLIAYNRESGVVRADYVEPLEYALLPEVGTVQVSVTLRRTAVEIRAAPAGSRTITGAFSGARESLFTPEFRVEGGVARLTLRETARSGFPALKEVGKATFTLFLPPEVAAELTVINAEGEISVNTTDLSLQRLALTAGSSGVTAVLGTHTGLIGDLRAPRGAVTVTLPPGFPVEITPRGGGGSAPRFDEARFIRRIDGVLIPRDAAAPQMQLVIDAAGPISVQ
jgi:hypothetical protein